MDAPETKAMTVHVGRVTSDVTSTSEPQTLNASDHEAEAPWEQQCRLKALLERLERDALRTATDCAYD